MTSRRFAVRGGTNIFSVVFAENGQPGSILATYQNDREPGSLSAAVAVTEIPLPTLEWLTNPVAFEGEATLRLVVPQDSAGIGEPAQLIRSEDMPFQPGPAFPAGTEVDLPEGWVDTVLTLPVSGGPELSVRVLQMDEHAPGTYDFVYSIGAGSTPVTPTVRVAGQNIDALIEAPLSIVPA
ncbi:MAG: hypothetical protein Q7T71_02265 [Herbiconiux sp.]|nr:hypothetical protein [Herbiconiux sp.]